MGAGKLREELYLLINNADEEYLKAIHTLLVRALGNVEEEKTDFWDVLSKKEKEDIKSAIVELDDGKGIPHEKVMTDLRSKYGKV